MGRKTRNLIRLCAVIILVSSGLLYLLLELRFAPVVQKLAAVKVDNDASEAIVAAVQNAISSGKIDYDTLVHLEKDEKGNISALKTNMREVNTLKTDILNAVGQSVLEISEETLSVPAGSVFFPELFSGCGPMLPVNIVAVRSSNADFESRFYEAGINQTQHQIVLVVTMQVTVLTPAGSQTVEVKTDVVVAETVIVGAVPETYVNMQ